VLATLSDDLYALLAGGASDRLRGSKRAEAVSRYGSGSVLIGLGLAAALAGDGRKQSPATE